ncbi:MAG: OmpA family protein [Aureispira sp.]|nr:OmpA family protein [Aureispira sp.]
MLIFRLFIISLISLVTIGNNIAQKYGKELHTENNPSYLQWRKNYKLTKIQYYEKRTIFHVELEFSRNNTGWVQTVSFLPPGETNSWVLKDPTTNKAYEMLEIRHVKHNNKEIKSRLRYSKDKVFLDLKKSKRSHEKFSCEIHFKSLPSHVKKVNILEGIENKYADGHWNFFEIHLKTFGSSANKTSPIDPYLEQSIGDNIEENAPDPKTEDNNSEKTPILNSSKDIECNKIFRLNNIQFKDNSTRFENTTLAERSLNMLHQYLKIDPDATLILYGHTDIFGEAQRNMDLSKQRVEKLQLWLVDRGLRKYRVKYEYFGSEQPVNPKGGPENRRVEVKILCDD